MTDRGRVETARKPPRWPERVALRDGSELAIRPIRPTDKKRLLKGFEQLSPESRYRRFLVAMPRLRGRLVRYLTEIDHHDHEALVALGADNGEPIGVARYVRSEGEVGTAEVAVAVADNWQGRGVATELLKRLADRAREEGIVRFTATCLADNQEVLQLLDELGTMQVLRTESGLIEAEIELPAGEEGGLRALLREAATKRLLFRPPEASAQLGDAADGRSGWPPHEC